MENIKISNFAKDHPEISFPKYVSLDKEACSKLTKLIRRSFNLTMASDGLALVMEVDKLSKSCDAKKNIADNFNLSEFLRDCEINADKDVFVNWYRYDKIDKLKLIDLSTFFHDLRYPEVDDIDIFDNSFQWILSIRHDGNIKLLRKK
jgi:hypothetical protein